MSPDLELLKYPVGRFVAPAIVKANDRENWLESVSNAPGQLRAAVAGLSEEQLDTPYRPDGWTIRQVVHHVADSHMNSYVRMRLALTEDHPTIRPYDERRWAVLGDAKSGPVGMSLDLVEALHRRWVILLRGLDEDQFRRGYHHPESGDMTLELVLALYDWHGRHHTAHITSLRERQGW